MRLIFILFITLSLNAQNNFEDEKEIINHELNLISKNRDSLFVYNKFSNKLLYGWFRAEKEKFNFTNVSNKLKDLLFEIALGKEAVKDIPEDLIINSAYLDNKKIYFLDLNNNYIKDCKNGSINVKYETFLKRDKVHISQPFFSVDKNSAVIYYVLNDSIYYSLYQKKDNFWIRILNRIVSIG